jgi:hypothetical protein
MSSAGDDDREERIIPWLDGLDRFEREVDTQVRTIERIEDKAQQTARIVAVLLGFIATAVPIALRFSPPELEPTPSGLLLLLGVSGLVGITGGLVGAIVAYLSSQTELALGPQAADHLATRSVPPSAYKVLVLGAFASTLETNQEVIQRNLYRFQLALSSLVFGIISLVGAAFLLATAASEPLAGVIFLSTSTISIFTAMYTMSDSYFRVQK